MANENTTLAVTDNVTRHVPSHLVVKDSYNPAKTKIIRMNEKIYKKLYIFLMRILKFKD